MPLVDKPLPELLEYRGRNPRPDDFDAYWAAALEELDATDPQPELRPNATVSTRQTECFDLWFTGLMDTICPPSTQFAAYNKITAKKNLVTYPDFAHEPLPGQIDRTFNFLRGL